MLRCWRGDPSERPTFLQLVEELTRLLMSMSDYMDLNFISTFDPWTGNPREFATVADITKDVTLELAETILPSNRLTMDARDPEPPNPTEDELDPEIHCNGLITDGDDPEAPKPTENELQPELTTDGNDLDELEAVILQLCNELAA